MSQAQFSDGQCLDFDFAVVQWWDWFEAKRDERKQVREDPADKLRKGYTWGQKYQHLGEIFELYRFEDARPVVRSEGWAVTHDAAAMAEVTELFAESMEDQL